MANILWFLKKLFSFLAALLYNLFFNFIYELFFNVHRLSGRCLVVYLGISADVKIRGWPFNKMVFFDFHQYLAPNFHLNIFFSLETVFVLFATSNDVSLHLVSNILQVIVLFIFCAFLCYARNKPQYFTFKLRKFFTKSHLTKVQAFFYKVFEKFNNDLCEKRKKWGYKN